MNPITTQDLLTIPGILALVMLVLQLVKSYLPPTWIGAVGIILAIVVALVGSVVAGQMGAGELLDAFLRGLVAALAAMGTFEVVKPLGLLQTRSQQMIEQEKPK